MTQFRALGRLPARADPRVPKFSAVEHSLPPPPRNSNWYAAVGEWPMLANDQYGDCVFAAIGHAVQAMTKYTNTQPLSMSNSEALAAYSAVTGFNPNDPASDQGTYVAGPGGAIDYWTKHGITCGGVLNKLTIGMTLQRTNPTQWRQGIALFGGALVGINLPEEVAKMPVLPLVWPGSGHGPYAGGHEIWVCGYETLNTGEILYDFVSWGQVYRVTEDFLLNAVEEAVIVLDKAFCNAQGVSPAAIVWDTLVESMRAIGGHVA